MKSPLLQSLFDEEERRPLTVSEVTEKVKSVLERSFKSIWLEGEIVNFVEAASGHWYFTLRDEFSQLNAACYRGSNLRIRFKPFDGLQVRVSGKISVYAPKGEYQILVESLEPVGEGAMKVAFEQLKAKLEREGLFAPEIKRPLPFFPRRVGVITSPNGAAIHDILHVLSRRTRTVDVLFIPTRVQGESAPQEIRDAIELVNEYQFDNLRDLKYENLVDVLIIGRGGGAMEDLWAFNDERVARAIRDSMIPVISAVGHETDFTIADFVADFRAPTPSAAAEIVAAQESNIAAFIVERTEDLRQIIGYRLLEAKSQLNELRSAPVFAEMKARVLRERSKVEANQVRLQNVFVGRVQQNGRKLDRLNAKLTPAIVKSRFVRAEADLQLLRQKLDNELKTKLDAAGEKLGLAAGKLNALSPLGVLSRGYSLTQKANGEIVHSVEQVGVKDELKIRLAHGKINCQVSSLEKD